MASKKDPSKPDRKPGPRYTDAQVAIRRKQIEELLLMPSTRSEIAAEILPKWDISDSQIDEDVAFIRNGWREKQKIEAPFLREEALERYRRKLKKTELKEDYSSNVAFEKLFGQVGGYLGAENQQQINLNITLEQIADASWGKSKGEGDDV